MGLVPSIGAAVSSIRGRQRSMDPRDDRQRRSAGATKPGRHGPSGLTAWPQRERTVRVPRLSMPRRRLPAELHVADCASREREHGRAGDTKGVRALPVHPPSRAAADRTALYQCWCEAPRGPRVTLRPAFLRRPLVPSGIQSRTRRAQTRTRSSRRSAAAASITESRAFGRTLTGARRVDVPDYSVIRRGIRRLCASAQPIVGGLQRH